MKKQYFVLIFFLLPFLVNAQTETTSNAKNVQLGFSLTPNINWLRENETNQTISSSNSRVGFSYGVLADIGLASNNNYYFSTAFTLTTMNSSARMPDADSSVPTFSDYTYKLQYVEVPLTIKLKSNPNNIGRYYGQFGLGTAFKVGAKADITSAGTASQENVNIMKNINNLRFGLIAGAGAEWRVDENIDIQTGITFNNGFTDVFDEDPNARNSYIALNLGIFF